MQVKIHMTLHDFINLPILIYKTIFLQLMYSEAISSIDIKYQYQVFRSNIS